MSDEREVLASELFATSVGDLAHQVVDSGDEPEVILGIARGGQAH